MPGACHWVFAKNHRVDNVMAAKPNKTTITRKNSTGISNERGITWMVEQHSVGDRARL
jgi:hypothetical protein